MSGPGSLVQELAAEFKGVLEKSDGEGLFTQDMVATGFAEQFVERFRHDHDAGRWFEWDGVRWAPDRTERGRQAVRELARDMADKVGPGALRQAGSANFIAGVEQLARGDGRLAVTSDVWDADPWLLGTPSGTVDLRTGRLRPAEPDHMITKLTAVGPAVEAHCPVWKKFVAEVTHGDPAYARFLQQWFGYCLTGSTREHALAFAYGPGGRGKGVFLAVMSGILADYAVASPMETFTESHNSEHPTELARLRGARLVTASETQQGRAWAESRIKQLTGGDMIAARFMRADYFEFMPTFKLTIIGNDRPALRNVGDAERRRFNFLPFDFKPPVPDRMLGDRLREEWSGILTWAIDGCIDWQENGLVRPAIVTDATADYFAAQDVFGAWIEAELDVDLSNDFRFESTATLYASWRAYAQPLGEREGSHKAFGEKMQARGFVAVRTKHARGYRGIRLRTPEQAADVVTGDAW